MLIKQLKKHHHDYANLLRAVRQFFLKRHVTEVMTDALSPFALSDVYIDSLETVVNEDLHDKKTQYLHTSPELAMKVLLAQGMGDIYQIARVFRNNETGRYNRNEFVMLEWYRLGFDDQLLMQEVADLVKQLLTLEVEYLSYQEAFQRFVGIDNIHGVSLNEIQGVLKEHRLSAVTNDIEGQMLLFTHCVLPALEKCQAVFVYDYPCGQAALAKIVNGVAKRFELFIGGVEVANGYWELTKAQDYQQRFQNELKQRAQLAKFCPAINEDFLHAIAPELPTCSGVALGLDRLFMIQQQQNTLVVKR